MAEVRAPEIKTLRHGLGLSQESLSRVLDVSARSVERWEAKGAPSVSGGT
jgi:DNA-binding transcriptional regulator YiaG